jgi:hypothetical protein
MQYKREVPLAPAPQLDTGRQVHAALLLLVRRLVRGEVVDVQDILFRTIRGDEWEFVRALKVLTRFVEALGTEFDIDVPNVFVLEERLAMPVQLWDGREAGFYGTPDLGEKIGRDMARITDWKTHWVPHTRDEFMADQQLPRYALLIHHHYPVLQRFELVMRYVRWSNNVHTRVLTVADLPAVADALRSEIQTTLELDEAGSYEATPGEWCALCSVHSRCPRIREFLDDEPAELDNPSIADDAEAQKLAASAHALECAAKRIKDRLKRYLSKEHPTGYVPLPGGGVYGFGPRNHRRVAYHPVVRELARAGISPPPELAQTDLREFDRMVARLPATYAKLALNHVEHWQSPAFRYRRVPAEPAPPPDEELIV